MFESLEIPITLKEKRIDSPIRVCACIDMDAFYAQAESRRLGLDDSIPLGTVQYAHLIAVNYAAKSVGVPRGCSAEEAKKICPNIILVHVDTYKLDNLQDKPEVYQKEIKPDKFEIKERTWEKPTLDYYRFESERIMAVLMKSCSIVEKASIDEAFLDITSEVHDLYRTGNYQKEWKGKFIGGEPYAPETLSDTLLMIGTQIIEKIRHEVKGIYNYTCSAGISYNKMLAKLGSGLNKPNGQSIITEKYTIEALKPIEIRKIRNFGRRIGTAFEEAGFKKVHQVLDMNLDEIKKIVGEEHTAKYVYFRVRGHCDEKIQEKDFEHKSIMSRKSFNPSTNLVDVENMLDLVIKDLATRCITFYDQHHLVAQSFALHYWDQTFKSERSKSGPINLMMKKEHFLKVLKDKALEQLKSVVDVIMPCKFIGASVRNFKKNDSDKYEFDLISYANKQKEKMNLEKQNSLSSLPIENSNLGKDFESTKSSVFEEAELELCEKCGKKIPLIHWQDHQDFHSAEDLDRELNPNKRKYKHIEEKTEANGDSKVTTKENKKTKEKEKDPSHETKKVKKTKPKENEKPNNLTIDKFFSKKEK